MIDDVQSYVAAAEVLKERGACKIYVLATHGLLSSDAPRLIEESPIDEVMLSHHCIVLPVLLYTHVTTTERPYSGTIIIIFPSTRDYRYYSKVDKNTLLDLDREGVDNV